jgi:hypothetical protein
MAKARVDHEPQGTEMHIEIHRRAQKPKSFSVVLCGTAGQYGILAHEIPSFAEARRLARKEGFERGVLVVNKVEDAIEHASPARHGTGPLGGASAFRPGL